MERTLYYLLEERHFTKKTMAFIVGPRQVGKTYLAKAISKKRNSIDLYRSWDDLKWRREFVRNPYGFIDSYRPQESNTRPIIVLDEIHKYPKWKRYVKGLWDTRNEVADVIVTGSGRLDVYQRGGDSLFGRYHQYRLHPFSLREFLEPMLDFKKYNSEEIIAKLKAVSRPPTDKMQNAFKRLLRWGGFPRPFIAEDENELRLWHRERRQLLIKEDLRDMSRIQLISHVEELVELLSEQSGQVLSYNSIREDLQVALESARLWVDYLQRLYYIYLLRPYAGRLARAIRREPKVYLWDWSEIENEGARFENMLASHLLKWCHFTEDWGFEPLGLNFVRDKEKREVDFLITKNKKPWILIEAKVSETEPSQAIHYFAEKMGVKNKFLVVANLTSSGTSGDVHVVNAASFLSLLPA